MPNIFFATEGLTVYNITEIGGDQTGTFSEFIINPLPGYYVYADQFSSPTPEAEDIYTSIVFSNTSTAGFANNNVKVKINWDGTTSIAEDYILNIVINYDGSVPSTSSSTTNVSYTFQTPLSFSNVSINELPLQSNQVLNHGYVESSPGVYDVSFTALAGSIPLEVGYFEILLDNPGQEFFDYEEVAASAIAEGGAMAALNGGGINFNSSFTYNFEYENNAFGDAQKVFVTIFYTTEPDLTEDHGAVVQLNLPQRTSYYLYFVDSNGEIITQQEVDYQGGSVDVDFETNIPISNLPPNVIEPIFSETWATGTINIGGDSVNIVFTAIPGGASSRTCSLTIQDLYYENTSWGNNSSLTILQSEDDYASIYIGTDQPGGVGTTWLYTQSDGKVVSRPNTSIGENVYAVNAGQSVQNYYEDNFVGGVLYKVKISANSDLTTQEVTNAFSVTQTGYPTTSTIPRDWVDFSDFVWVNVNPGVWERNFYIRNNDALNDSPDRTATLTFTHPDDGAVTASLDINQDANYGNTIDTVELKISYATSNAGPFTDSTYDDVSSVTSTTSGSMLAILKIKMADWENDFNLPNDYNTDDSVQDIYKQYNRPRVFILHSGEVTNQDGFVNNPYEAFFIADAEATYNANYDPLDSDNDHQYYFNAGEVFANASAQNRYIEFRVHHSQNPSNLSGSQDATLTFTQPSNDVVLLERPVGESFEPVSQFLEYTYASTGGTALFKLIHTGATPTVGLWNTSTNTYTALTEGTYSSNGFKYNFLGAWEGSPPAGLLGEFQKLLAIGRQENTSFEDRNEVFGFWHENSSTSTDTPDYIIRLKQQAAVFTAANYPVSFMPGAQPETISNSGGTLSYTVKVGDYSQANFDADSNVPQYEVVRVDSQSFPALGSIVNDVDNIIGSTSITKNSSWTVGSNDHTHTIAVTFNSHYPQDQKYFAVRVKHSLNDQDNWQDTVTSRLYPVANVEVLSTVIANQEGEQLAAAQALNYVQYDSISASVGHADGFYLGMQFKLNNLYSFVNKLYLYPNRFDFIFGRFISDSEETVLDESNGILSEANMYNIIPRTPEHNHADWVSSSYSGYVGASVIAYVNDESAYGGDSFSTYNINANAGSARSRKVGLWTGDTVPKTNLIDTSTAPTFSYTGGFWLLGLSTYSDSGGIFESMYTATQGSDDSYNSFSWNPTGEVWGDQDLSSNYIIAEFDTGITISEPTEFGLQFTVSGLQYNGSPQDVGIVSGWFESPFNYSLAELENYLKVTENGTYYARLKVDNANPTIKFLLRGFAKVDIKDIVFWNIEKDAKLELNQVITSTPPDFVLTINQSQNPDVSSISFPNGSPAQGFSPLGEEFRGIWALSTQNVINVIGGVSHNPSAGYYSMTSSGELEFYDFEPYPNNLKISFKTVNSSTSEPWPSPYVRLWDGSSITSDSDMFIYPPFPNAAGFQLVRFSPNYEDTVKTYTVGFWPAQPANNAVPPILTQVVKIYPYGNTPF